MNEKNFLAIVLAYPSFCKKNLRVTRAHEAADNGTKLLKCDLIRKFLAQSLKTLVGWARSQVGMAKADAPHGMCWRPSRITDTDSQELSCRKLNKNRGKSTQQSA